VDTPELVKRWSAGHRGEMTVAEIDLRVGGTWRYVVASGGYEVAFHGEFREIVPNERDRLDRGLRGHARGVPAVNTVTFSEVDGRTTLTMLAQLTSKEVRDMIIDSGMELGMQEGMDLLEEIALSLG
jgi:uncharacterized protein YndB with AHSA1/START domain